MEHRHEISKKELGKFIDKQKILEVPVEERLSKEQLHKLWNDIHFTHQVMKEEADRRLFGSDEEEIGTIKL
jgi:hypothetical protein